MVTQRIERAIVTGATRGIGRAVALSLAKRGAKIAAIGRDERAMAALVHDAAHDDAIVPIIADLAGPGRDDAIDASLSALGGCDLLVQAAGIVRYASFLEAREDDVRAQLEVDLLAPFFVAQRVVRGTRERHNALAIVHVASTLAVRAAAQTSAYAAAKAGLLALTRSMAIELAPNVRVNAVVPGVVDTDMVRGEREGVSVEKTLATLAALHPMGRIATPDEVAEAILLLAASPFTTGAALAVDGGLLAGDPA